MEKFKCICGKIFNNRQSYAGHSSRCPVKREGNVSPSNLKRVDRESVRACKFCNLVMEIRKLGAHATNCSLNPSRSENIQKRCRAKRSPMSDSQKEKISIARRKYLEENPSQVPYRLNHSSKESYPEKIFRELLDANNITGWIQEYPLSIYQLDFCFEKLKIDVEIDGETHQSEKVKKIDNRRDEYLISRGWKIYRINSASLKAQPQKNFEEFYKFLISQQ